MTRGKPKRSGQGQGWLLASAAVTAIVTAGCGHPEYPRSAAHPLLGGPLPEIHHGKTLDGRALAGTEFVGKPVVVKFFADYCEPCKKSLPEAERVHASHPALVFVGVDEDEAVETAAAVAQRFGLTFAVVHDRGNVLAARFRVRTMPMTFVADAAGVIRWVGDERQTEEDLTRAVDAAEGQ